MKLHDLRPASGAHHARKRVGRGIAAGGGKTAGRGTKGQKARAGASIPAWFEGGQTPLQIRIPKLHGFKNRFRVEYEVVNLGRIAALVEAGIFEPGDRPGARKAAAERRGRPRRSRSTRRSSRAAGPRLDPEEAAQDPRPRRPVGSRSSSWPTRSAGARSPRSRRPAARSRSSRSRASRSHALGLDRSAAEAVIDVPAAEAEPASEPPVAPARQGTAGDERTEGDRQARRQACREGDREARHEARRPKARGRRFRTPSRHATPDDARVPAQRVPRARHPAPDPVRRRDPDRLPPPVARARPGRELAVAVGPLRQQPAPRPARPVLGRRPVALLDRRAWA